MQELKPIKEGKVREIYDNGDSLIMVATDRISCFDVILHNEVTSKGAVLTQMSKFWFDLTKDILPNHMISVDTKDMPEFFQQKKFEGKTMMCRKLHMLPIECIVRGYITGRGTSSSFLQIFSRSRSILRPQRLRSATMMRIFPSSRASTISRNTSRERAASMRSFFVTALSLYIKNVQSTPSQRESSSPIQNSNSVLTRRATS